MIFLEFFDNIWFNNIILSFIIFYLLSSICFASHFACCDFFDRPILLNSFNLFSIFFLSLLIWLFCFDFIVTDKLYFFSQNFQLLFLFIIVCTLSCSRDFLIAKNIIKYEYDLLFIFVILSALCLCFCNEFLLVYLAIELQSLTLYVFATFNRNSEFATEAGLKYFVFGGLISCFFLFGLALVYLYFGSISFELISSIVSFGFEPLFFFGFLFILIVFLFKLGSAPFHFWICDVYEGSVLSVTMLFASAPKIILFAVLFKIFFFILFDYEYYWSYFIGFSAISSIIIGSISAIYQKRLKRLFAYSTIAHTGFILSAFLICSLESAKAIVFYIIVYSTLTIALFSILINSAITNKIQPIYLINFSSLGTRNYIFAVSFALIILSIAGIPPLAGFFSKLFILITLIGAKYYFISFLIIFLSSIACFYYIRLVKIIFFFTQAKNNFWVTNKSKQNTEFFIGFFLFVIICLFLRPNFFIDLAIVLGLTLF